MADFEKYFPIYVVVEGGWVFRKDDRGGATNMGITLNTWKRYGHDIDKDGDIDIEDLKKMQKEDSKEIIKAHFWDDWKADRIASQSVANLLVDWLVNSGLNGKKIPQRLFGVDDDGVIGPKTLIAVNNAITLKGAKAVYDMIMNARKKYYLHIAQTISGQSANLKGWNNRLKNFKFVG
jgi:lysozyme family protein